MDLTHEFTVPASIDEVWTALNDIESVAGCFPGATVSGVEGDTFTGSCKVKLGPIALVYNGSGTFVELDEANHTMRIEAKGKDKRGNGTAGADVTATMAESDGQTRVEVVTDLNITGKPAQFGRGVIQDVSDKLLGQFVECLAERVAGPSEPAQAGPAQGAGAGSTDAAPGDAAPGTTASVAPTPSTGQTTEGEAMGSSAEAGAPVQPTSSGPPPRTSAQSDEALDLGATVLPVLLKSYGKQIAAGLGAVVVLVWLLRRRRSG